MKVLDDRSFVQCRRPRGCGWYWQRRTVLDHWWSKPRYEYRGAFWEHERGEDRYSSRPEPGNHERWMSQEEWEISYSDCVPLTGFCSLEDAQANSRMKVN